MKSRVARYILAMVALAVAVPALGQVTEDDISRARRDLDRAMAEAADLGDQVQEAWARQLELEHEISKLEEAIGHASVQLADAEERFIEVSIEMYMSAASGTGVGMMMNVDQSTYQAGLEYLKVVNGSGRELINQLSVLGTELERLNAAKIEASAEQEELTSRLEVMAADLLNQVGSAQVYYDGLVATKARQDEEERQRRLEEARLAAAAATSTSQAAATSAPPQQPTTTTATTTSTSGGESAPTTTAPSSPPANPGGGVCPVAGPVSFTDSWGSPRSGGRSHQGVDMIAARGTPIVAIYSGRIHRITTGSLSGLAVWLRAENGDQFFYAHLDSYGDISTGQQVEAGYVIGYNGSTGNAPDWLPHLHFEWHPRGGAAVNPYPLVRSLC